MVEVTEADRRAYLSLNMLPEFDQVDVLAGRWDNVTGIQAFASHRQAGVQQGLDMAAGVVEEGSSRWRDKSSATANKRESRDYETMAIACIHVAAAIRKLGGGDA